MAIGKRIKFFRNRKNLTQKQLGEMLGFMGKTSEVRMAQYEAETHMPKDALIKQMAYYLDVSPQALTVPDIDTQIGLMHTLFALEDSYGFKIKEINGEICLSLDNSYASLYRDLSDWQNEFLKLENHEISKEEYDQWRYTYPEMKVQRLKEQLDHCRTVQNAPSKN